MSDRLVLIDLIPSSNIVLVLLGFRMADRCDRSSAFAESRSSVSASLARRNG